MSIKQNKPADRAIKPMILSWLWKLTGIILIMIGIFCGVLVIGNRGSLKDYDVFHGVNSALFAGLAALFGSIGVACFNRGRKLSAVTAQDLISQDPRPPVLYLRSFKDDSSGATVFSDSSISPVLQSMLGTSFDVNTEEEEISSVMNSIGPFIAIGRPGEKLPELGAARTYTGNGEWQDTIINFMVKSQLVVLRIGESDGFWWEVQRASEYVKPEKILFLIPNDEGLYDYFRHKAKAYLPCKLPEYPQSEPTTGGSIRGLIYFERDSTPHFMNLRASLARRMLYGSNLKPTLKMSLRPLFEQLNIPWTPPSKLSSTALKLASVPFIVAVVTASYLLIARPKSFEETTPDYVRRITANPEIKRVFQHLSPSQANALAKDLSSKGLRRLNDSLLLQRASLVNKLLAVSDPTDCAAFALGNITESQMEEALKKLEPSDVDAFSSIAEQAVLAEIRKSLGPMIVSGRGLTEAVNALFNGLPKDQATRLQSLLSGDTSKLSGEDACRAARQLYEKVLQLHEPHRSILLRAMVSD